MSLSAQLGSSLENLHRRSDLLAIVRQFFLDRDFTEVETPLLSDEIIPELHIEPFRVTEPPPPLWLQASPELHMKRLLAAGMSAIFQITRSFRTGESGRLHIPEFTIIEWYRVGDDMHAGMNFLDDLCQVVLGTLPSVRTSYAEAFEKHVGVCPHTATVKQLAERAAELNLAVPDDMPSEDRDEWLNLLLAMQVEPQLGRNAPELLYDYPASQAALARIVERETDKRLAERYELYWGGLELANGYHELTDATELRSRLEEVNRLRETSGRSALPMPNSLFAAMDDGLPDCAGCALGFDRLAMAALGTESLNEVIAFNFARTPRS